MAKLQEASSAADLALHEERWGRIACDMLELIGREKRFIANIATSQRMLISRDHRAKQETHQVAARKMAQMDRLRGALGLGEGQREGEAFDRELQERRRQEKIAEREQREREKRYDSAGFWFKLERCM